MNFGQAVTFVDVDGSEKPALVVGVRTDTEQGKNNEPLLSLGMFRETNTFGAPEPTVLHDIPHQSHEPEEGQLPRERRRWKAVGEEAVPEPAAVAAGEQSGEQKTPWAQGGEQGPNPST